MTTVDFQIVNSVGTVVATADSADLAKAYVLRNKLRFPSLRVERVTVTTERQVIYQPRQARAA